MLKVLSILVLCALILPTHEQTNAPFSPCPNVFMYDTSTSEPNRWYGTVNLSTDSTLHSVWLNVVLDSKADILGNWVGDVSTTDNLDFKIENTKMKVQPGPAVTMRFFVQYNPLNKPPRLQAIRLNGREICNAKNPLPAVDRPEIDSQTRPNRVDTTTRTSRPRPHESNGDTNLRPQDTTITKPIQGRPHSNSGDNGPVYVPTSSPVDPDANPYSIGGGQVNSQSIGSQTGSRPNQGFGHTTTRPHRTTTERDDDDYGNDRNPDEYFTGGRPSIPSRPTNNNNNNNNHHSQGSQSSDGECGRVLRPNPLVVNGRPTLEGQWPWQIALYQTQTVDSKYICGGTLVSKSHVITAAHCVTRKGSSKIVNKNTLTVYLGKHNLRTSVEGVQIRFVQEIKVHPQYNASSYALDLGILLLREDIRISEWVRPACLWPENEQDLNNVIGKKGAVVGWGFDDTGVATEELTLVEMPVVDQETCIRSYSEFFVRFTSEYTYCAGYKDGALDEYSGTRKSTSVCNGDSGGGMVFKKQNIWYLRGLVSLSVARQNEYRCDPTHYVVFTDLAKFLPWIRENIQRTTGY